MGGAEVKSTADAINAALAEGVGTTLLAGATRHG